MSKSKLISILKPVAITLTCVFVLVWGAWLVAVPSDMVLDKLSEGLHEQGVDLRAEGFGKGLFFSVKSEMISFASVKDGTTYLSLSDVRISLGVLDTLLLKPSINLDATLGGGKLTGLAGASLMGGKSHVMLNAGGVSLAKLGLENIFVGLKAAGALEFDMALEDGEGEARLKLDKLDFLPYKYLGFTLPLDRLQSGRALAVISPDTVNIKSAALEGHGIYARLSGTLNKAGADLKAELMPSAELEQELPYFAMMSRYKVTDGHYTIPIRRAR